MSTKSLIFLCQTSYKTVYYKTSKRIPLTFRNLSTTYKCTEKAQENRSQKSKHHEILKYKEQFKILELTEDSDKDAVRRQYINLVKRYHPDTAKQEEQSLERFHQIDQAYKDLQKLFIQLDQEERDCEGEYGLYYQEKNCEEESNTLLSPDIRHTAPQHRQYLSNEGLGFGTPYQRQQQHQKIRAMRASENVYQHNVGKLTAKYETRIAEQERKATKKHHTKNAMDRLVEDLIQESMSKGDFDNLSGSGKPLPQRVIYNPYEDFTTYKVNQILVEGGFAPEWIMLKRDILDQQNEIRKYLASKCEEFCSKKKKGQKNKNLSQNCDIHELSSSESPSADEEWSRLCDQLEQENEELKLLNKNIDKFNLIVPMMKSQMFHFPFKKEADRIYKAYLEKIKQEKDEATTNMLNETEHENFGDYHSTQNVIKSSTHILGKFLKQFVTWIKDKGGYNEYRAKS